MNLNTYITTPQQLTELPPPPPHPTPYKNNFTSLNKLGLGVQLDRHICICN